MYPKYCYHAVKEAVVVRSVEEEAALGEGWAETPAVFADLIEGKVTEPEPVAEVKVEAQQPVAPLVEKKSPVKRVRKVVAK